MNKDVITFGDIEIEKHKFHVIRVQFFLEDTDIDKLLILTKFLLGKNYKYLITYKYLINT